MSQGVVRVGRFLHDRTLLTYSYLPPLPPARRAISFSPALWVAAAVKGKVHLLVCLCPLSCFWVLGSSFPGIISCLLSVPS